MNHLDSDYFSMCSSTGDQFAGRHILADFWGVERMSDLDFIKKTIEESARKAGANILHSYYPPFGDGMGVSGVTVLSESHISIHTWPERSFASIDVFMCGNCDPQTTINYLEKTLKPSSIDQSLNRRGVVSAVAQIYS
jgi:S-adenosylmethionine decarboxylase